MNPSGHVVGSGRPLFHETISINLDTIHIIRFCSFHDALILAFYARCYFLLNTNTDTFDLLMSCQLIFDAAAR